MPKRALIESRPWLPPPPRPSAFTSAALRDDGTAAAAFAIPVSDPSRLDESGCVAVATRRMPAAAAVAMPPPHDMPDNPSAVPSVKPSECSGLVGGGRLTPFPRDPPNGAGSSNVGISSSDGHAGVSTGWE